MTPDRAPDPAMPRRTAPDDPATVQSVEALPGRAEQARIVNVFAKAIVPGDGRCRGRRFCMLEDPVLGTKPARAVVNAVIASVTGDPMNFVSGGEVDSHQGPPGGMPCAAIVRVA